MNTEQTVEIEIRVLQSLMRDNDRLTYRGVVVRRRDRFKANPDPGLKSRWSEFQVIGNGRRIQARFDSLMAAVQYINEAAE